MVQAKVEVQAGKENEKEAAKLDKKGQIEEQAVVS